MVLLALSGCVDASPKDESGLTHYQSGGVPVLSWDQAVGPAGSGGAEPQAGAAGTSAVPGGQGGVAGMAGMGGVGAMGGGGGTGGMQAPAGAGGASGAAGTGGTDVTAGTGGQPSAPASILSSLTVDFTTANQGGRYAPKNIGAVWVADASGKWVKTLERWAWIRGQYLSKYNAANPLNNVVDAVTSATKPNHGAHHLTWNLTGADGAKVAPGDYKLLIECTEREDRPGEWIEVAFSVGPDSATVTPADSPYYKGVSLTYE